MTISTGDRVTHWSHEGQVGEVVETEPCPGGGFIFHVMWPGNETAIPYHSTGTLELAKNEES